MLTKKKIDRLIILYCFLLAAFLIYTFYAFRSKESELNTPVLIKLRYYHKYEARKNESGNNVALQQEQLEQIEILQTLKSVIDHNRSVPLEIVAYALNGYDALVQNSNRLGFSVGRDYQKLPLSWVESLKSVELEAPKPKRILLYEQFNWWNPEEKMTCTSMPRYRCEFFDYTLTEDALYSGQTITDAGQGFDAILIPRDFAHSQPIGGRTASTWNLTRVFYTLESPKSVYFKVSLEPRDYLASYWRGSDIYNPYFRWQYDDPKITEKIQTRNYADGRTKMAAIVVSNCGSSNNRPGFIKELNKYISVDIFGACGDPEYCSGTEDCFDKIKNDYKFYLALENANCRDYITEKFHFNALKHELIPIVMGAHPSDYKTVAPRNSYIHIEDFKSVRDLANHLIDLNANDTLYNEYFAWKGTGKFVKTTLPCELCAFLHAREFEIEDEQAPRSFLNLDDPYETPEFHWTGDMDKMCLGYGKWYWNP